MFKRLASFFLLVLLGSNALSQTPGKQITVKVGGDTREALIYSPATADKTDSPVVFAFHGHGGTMKGAAKEFDYQKHWPQAIVVYMQGIPIPSTTDPKGKKAGWQHEVGEVNDRDLKFFDLTLAKVKKDYKVDESRIYATGHSNGGGFTYLLWAARGDTFAAVAPSSASSANAYLKELKPKPALHVAGEKDETAPFEKQRKLMDAIKKLNGCDSKGKPWEKKGMLFPSESGTPFIEVVHPAGHDFLEDAPRLIVRFFKDNAKK